MYTKTIRQLVLVVYREQSSMIDSIGHIVAFSATTLAGSNKCIKFALEISIYKTLLQYTLSIITSQPHCFQLRTNLNGKPDFKFFSHGLCTEKQNILLQHMFEKENFDFDQ